MEFFCLHRDRLGSAQVRQELLEEHWAYMDRYAAGMIARGPLLGDDGETPVGSVHILDLPDPAAAWLGTAALVRAADAAGARAVLAPERYAAIEVRAWRFGGRP